MVSPLRKMLTVLTVTVAALALGLPAAADPPPWAPAHGYRAKQANSHGKKHKNKYRQQSYIEDAAYVVPFGIAGGHCNREEIGALLGGAAGGYIGSQVAKGDARTATIIGGAILGVLIGGQIGRNMDDADHACVGQAMEYAEEGQTVAWVDPDSGTHYQVRPTSTRKSADGAYCREYQATAEIEGRQQHTYGTACRQPDGTWRMLN